MLLLLDYDNYDMEWTITGLGRQCPVTVSVIGLLNFFAMHCLLEKKFITSLAADFCPLPFAIGAVGKVLKKEFPQISGLARDPSVSDRNHDKAGKV